MVFDIKYCTKCVKAFDSLGENFLLSEFIPYIPPSIENITYVSPSTGEIILAIEAAALVESVKYFITFKEFIKERRKKQEKVDRHFAPLHKIVCDPGYTHPRFGGNIHTGNREAVKRLTSTWLAKMPIISTIAKEYGYPVWKNIKQLPKFQCTLQNDDLAGNILAIGSPRSTFTAQKALGYQVSEDKKLILPDDFKGILRWEFNIDYGKKIAVNQKIEGVKEGEVITDHKTEPYYFYDNKESKRTNSLIIKSMPTIEHAVITKIPNQLVETEQNYDTFIYIFEGLHSVGTKAIGDLIWKHIDTIEEEFKKEKIHPINDSYQILFSFPIEHYLNNEKKAFEPKIDNSLEPIVHKLSDSKLANLPEYRENN